MKLRMNYIMFWKCNIVFYILIKELKLKWNKPQCLKAIKHVLIRK